MYSLYIYIYIYIDTWIWTSFDLCADSSDIQFSRHRWFRLKIFTQGRVAQRLELVAGQQLVAEQCIWHTLWWFPVHVRWCTTAYWAITAALFWISTCSIRFSLLIWAVWVALKNDNTFPHKSGSLFEKQKKLRQVFFQLNTLRQIFFKISELRQLASTNLLLAGPFSETECLYNCKLWV